MSQRDDSTPSSSHAIGDDGASRTWLVTLAACTVAVALQCGFAPLADPDLPNHLSLGEWILAHRAVPFTEPFAWTRSGAPFYAYSWLAQIAMFALLRATGPVGLHVLAAVLGAAITVASAMASRALGSRWSGAVAFAVASAVVAQECTPFLRPQLVMHALVPLAWLCVARLRQGGSGASLVVLMLLSAVAANVHITFPVMAVPLVILFTSDASATRRRAWMAAAAVAAGWMLSPYATAWLDVFRLNFADNVITRPPAANGELAPGFIVSPLIGAAIAMLPVLAVPALRLERERLAYGALWLVGLLVFATIFKGLGPWWWCATPMVVAALSRIPRASGEPARRLIAALLFVLAATLAIPSVRLYHALAALEGDAASRTLPGIKSYATEPAARWLARHMRRNAGGRLLTVFNYGSYLKWRLPSLSESIDGRTIFPDSAALPDAVAERGVLDLGPWRSADVAIVPLSYPVAQLLDMQESWARIGVAAPAPWARSASPAGLWVRREWWARSRADRAPGPRDGILR
jgi:hypothetical protein